MNQPLIKATLLHFLEWMEKEDYRVPDKQTVELYLKQHPIPDFMEIPELNYLYSDANSDYDLGVRTGIEATWKVVKGE